MGGAAGHMSHPFDLPIVRNGSDLIKFFEDAGTLLTTNPGSVKIDGVNVSFKLVDGPRGKEFAVDRGSLAPIDIEGITADRIGERFASGHGMRPAITNLLSIFNEALPSIESELATLGLYDDPTIFFNAEYVKGTTNVLQYDEDFLAIHGVNQFYEKRSKIKGKAYRPGLERPIDSETKKPVKDKGVEIPYDKGALQSLIEKVAPYAERQDFKIYGDVPTEMVGEVDFGSTLASDFTVVFSAEDQITKSLGEWLASAENPIGREFEPATGKKTNAMLKSLYVGVLNGIPLTEIVKDAEGAKLVADAAVMWHATRLLGNDVMAALTSPMGDVINHEGVIVRNEAFGPSPVKITGEFIVKGLETSFPRGGEAETIEVVDDEEIAPSSTIGLVPLSAKPYHAGHHALVTMAAEQNDRVVVFVSTSDRGRKGEFPIYGADMERIWKDEIEKILPSNVTPIYGGSPVRNVYEMLSQANEEGAGTKYTIYSDPEDTELNYPVCNRLKYFPELYEKGLVMCAAEASPESVTRGVGTPDISGTKLRMALANNDFEAFAAGMPAGVDEQEIFDTLRREEPVQEQKKSLSLLYSLVEKAISEGKTKVSGPGQERVSRKIAHLVGDEGKSQEQAAAIAYSMEKEGELDEMSSMAAGAVQGAAGSMKKKKINGLIREEDLVDEVMNYLLNI